MPIRFILGAGAAGRASAAYLLTRGHEVIIWSPSGKNTAGFRDAPLIVEGEIAGKFHPLVADSAAEAMAGVELIFIALPANGQRMVYDEIACHAEPGQVVVINAQPILGGYALEESLRQSGKSNPIPAWGTTLLRSRQVGASGVRINTIRKSVDMAALPVDAEEGVALCRAAACRYAHHAHRLP